MQAPGAVERPATRRTGYAQGTQSPCWAVPESGGTDPGGTMNSDPHSGASVPPGGPALGISVVIAGLDVADRSEERRVGTEGASGRSQAQRDDRTQGTRQPGTSR